MFIAGGGEKPDFKQLMACKKATAVLRPVPVVLDLILPRPVGQPPAFVKVGNPLAGHLSKG
jgi:hypothetical protein